jgi:hypothetical protein
MGAIIRQGAHHDAQKSTSIILSFTCCWKFLSVSVRIFAWSCTIGKFFILNLAKNDKRKNDASIESVIIIAVCIF